MRKKESAIPRLTNKFITYLLLFNILQILYKKK